MSLDLKNENGNNYEKWNWFRNEIFIQSIWRDRYAVGVGISSDYFDSKITGINDYTNSHHFINTYAFIKSDTRDDRSFATRGLYLAAEGKVLDILNKFDDGKIIQLKINTQLNFPITDWLTYRLGLFGGITIGENLSPYYSYRMGGIFDQNLGNFVSFQGYQFGQSIAQNMLISSNTAQFKLSKNFFADANFSFANLLNDLNVDDVLHVSDSSAGITAGYKSPFGQIKINYSQALKINKGAFSVILGHWF